MDTIYSFFHQIFTVDFWVGFTTAVLSISMIIGKIVLASIMLFFAFCGFIVILKFQQWHNGLVQLEGLADRLRDDVMFEFTAARQRLGALKEKFARHGAQDSPSRYELTTQGIKNISAILFLFLQKERSLFQWGLAGFKLVEFAVKFFKR